jgi:hypothetical protein
MQDPFSNVTTVQAVAPQSVTSDTTTNGQNIELGDAFGLFGVMEVGGHSGGNFELLVEHADDDGTGNPDTYSEVPDKSLRGTEGGTNLSANGTAKIGYVGTKPFVRFSVVSAGGASGTVSATAVKTPLKKAPDTTQTRTT